MNIHDRHGLFDYLQRGAIVHHIKLSYFKSSNSLYYVVWLVCFNNCLIIRYQ